MVVGGAGGPVVGDSGAGIVVGLGVFDRGAETLLEARILVGVGVELLVGGRVAGDEGAEIWVASEVFGGESLLLAVGGAFGPEPLVGGNVSGDEDVPAGGSGEDPLRGP